MPTLIYRSMRVHKLFLLAGISFPFLIVICLYQVDQSLNESKWQLSTLRWLDREIHEIHLALEKKGDYYGLWIKNESSLTRHIVGHGLFRADRMDDDYDFIQSATHFRLSTDMRGLEDHMPLFGCANGLELFPWKPGTKYEAPYLNLHDILENSNMRQVWYKALPELRHANTLGECEVLIKDYLNGLEESDSLYLSAMTPLLTLSAHRPKDRHYSNTVRISWQETVTSFLQQHVSSLYPN